MKKALIAMSGGVDSSLAAKMMKDAGYECVGCTMKLYENEDIGIDRSKTCCSLEYQAGMTFNAALSAGVIPFIPGDLVKIIIALIAGPVLRKRLRAAGLTAV